MADYRIIPKTDIKISCVSLGMWPIAGISSSGTSFESSVATVLKACEKGINHFDTAFSYGMDGESDAVLKTALSEWPEPVIISSKVGTHYDASGQRRIDGSPSRIHQEANEICKRLDVETIDILYLHTPDPEVAIVESAEALQSLVKAGVARYVGLSNATPEQTEQFAQVIAPVLLQPPFNMLQQQSLAALQNVATDIDIGFAVYWPLMKGLLAGGLKRTSIIPNTDSRSKYSLFQGIQWERTHDFVDELREIAAELGWSVPQLVTRWTAEQPRVTTVLCGAKAPEQITESASAIHVRLPEDIDERIQAAIQKRLAAAPVG